MRVESRVLTWNVGKSHTKHTIAALLQSKGCADYISSSALVVAVDQNGYLCITFKTLPVHPDVRKLQAKIIDVLSFEFECVGNLRP